MKTKKCESCKQELTLDCFYKNKTRPDGLQTKCKNCNKNRCKNYYIDNKSDMVKTAIKNNLKYRQIAKQFVDNVKSHYGCINCTENDPCCLDCHHIKAKNDEISNLISNGKPLTTIISELQNCVIVCANCHRKIHANKIILPNNTKPIEMTPSRIELLMP